MAEPDYSDVNPIGIGPSPPPVNNRPAHPGHPNIITPPPTNNSGQPYPGQHTSTYHRDVDVAGTPDVDVPRSRSLPLQPFQPNWNIGHPLPWNNYGQAYDEEFESFILGANREG